ncbi:MAG: ATP:cob(I)alamin adenosyltransferase [Gammaproteobacteria bacterium]|jgi:cob(I)alamin adenosyltransferase|nr:ATP:cob(I)alamin adenosyltransferase [Gammaproteobacteria bacterium]
MGHRLSKIVTKTGDEGTTGLGDGSRIAKDDLRIEAIGTVDELNSAIGMLLSTEGVETTLSEYLLHIQHDLFNVGGELCIPKNISITAKDTERLEKWLEILNADLPYLQEFILPGGNPAASFCHLARTICRRAERRIISLHQRDNINANTLAYINRLSDLLFVMARLLARKDGGKEVLWQNKSKLSQF